MPPRRRGHRPRREEILDLGAQERASDPGDVVVTRELHERVGDARERPRATTRRGGVGTRLAREEATRLARTMG